jgi:hypothetical protein
MKPFPKLAVFLAAGILAPLASAHFKLSEPASWITENDLGDPQKLGPCGGTSANAGTVTNAVTKVQGGQKLHLKWNETVYHPGHYRIALSVNSRAELPPDPPVQTKDGDKGPQSVSAAVQNPPKVPVLVDNLFPHDMRPPAGTAVPTWETDVVLPNITCAKCTLQIVQFMAEHGLNKDGGYFYHHCADLQITADPKAPPADPAWPKQK